MRKLIWVLVGLGVLWGGYWFVGSSAVEKGLTNWLTDNTDRGWSSSYSSLNTTGFPNRFDTTVRDIEITSQNGGLVWSAPFFQVFALSYKPNHIIAIWPNEQTLTLSGDQLTITSDRMRSSVVFEAESALTLDRADLEAENLGVRSARGWSSAARSLQFNTRQSAGREYAHDVFLQLSGLRPSVRIGAILDPKNTLPNVFDVVRFDGILEFDGPWDRVAIEGDQPALDNIVVNKMQIVWGDLDFSATGNLAVDARGYLQGQLQVTAQNWQGIYRILVRMGLVQDNFFGAINAFLTLMALESPDPDQLVATWLFQDGQMRFGAIPLGPAPRLIRR